VCGHHVRLVCDLLLHDLFPEADWAVGPVFATRQRTVNLLQLCKPPAIPLCRVNHASSNPVRVADRKTSRRPSCGRRFHRGPRTKQEPLTSQNLLHRSSYLLHSRLLRFPLRWRLLVIFDQLLIKRFSHRS
jgi:hypothetical protein